MNEKTERTLPVPSQPEPQSQGLYSASSLLDTYGYAANLQPYVRFSFDKNGRFVDQNADIPAPEGALDLSDKRFAEPSEVSPVLLAKIKKDFEIDSEGPVRTWRGLLFLAAQYGITAYTHMYPQNVQSDEVTTLSSVQSAIRDMRSTFDLIKTEFGATRSELAQAAEAQTDVYAEFATASFATKNPAEAVVLNTKAIEVNLFIAMISTLSQDKHLIGKFMRNINNSGPDRAEDEEGPRRPGIMDEIWKRYTDSLQGIMLEAGRDQKKAARKAWAEVDSLYSGEYDELFVPIEKGEDITEEASEPALEDEASEEEGIMPTPEVNFEILPNQNLNFEVLPPDTDLRVFAEDLVEHSTSAEKAHVDLRRLGVLEEMRHLFGEDKCYYAKGVASGRMFETGNGERVDGDFLVLVMQHHNQFGVVVGEDALAISPIARRHAAFYMRQDVSEGLSWREVLALPKRDAQDLGVRKLRFTAPEGVDVYDAMLEKLFMLADCPVEDFNDELEYDERAGRYTTRNRRIRQQIAQRAAQAL